jgi:HAD superfamily hydrolase (TIGR01459 family)
MADGVVEAAVSPVAGLNTLAGRYDAVLCDVWGVIHNGVAAHRAAADALVRFRERGVVILVSNAPRPAAVVLPHLDSLGVPRGAYDGVLTSGDLARRILVECAGQAIHHLGPERDRPLFDGLTLTFTPVEAADAVICTGLLDDERETAEDYRGRLEAMQARALPMFCANPDIVVERGGQLIPCAGAIAALYEKIGGSVLYTGKPHRPIYQAALERVSAAAGRPVDPARILAVGDAIRTDIAGATAFGLDALLIARGIHAEELGLASPAARLDPAQIERWLATQGARPIGFMDKLKWE